MITQSELLTNLAYFTGTTQYYKHWLNRFVYTEGVQYLAEEAGAYWLIDAIASHQTRELLSNQRLRDFQLWTLKVENTSAVLICEEDTDEEVLRQEIEYTDFPLPELKLYLVTQVLMLPSEY